MKKGDTVTVNVNKEQVPGTFLSWSASYPGYATVEVDGKKLLRKLQGTSAKVLNPSPVKESRFDVNVRFEFIEEVTNMVITGKSNSVIITGSGGLGKTFTVLQCLKKAGLEEIGTPSEEQSEAEFGEEQNDEPAGGDYEVVKGFVTPKALYRLLYNNRERLVVFDDCDSVWDNPTTVSLLKAALDSYESRHISWFSEMKSEEDELPQRFEFKGKIVFVSNLSLNDLDQAVLSRCLYVDVSMSAVEKISRIKALRDVIRPDLTTKVKDECIAVIEKHKDNIGDLNIRTFLKVCEIRDNGREDWKDLAEYVITAL